jgi:hypothetical protein
MRPIEGVYHTLGTLALPIHFLSYQKGQQWTINEHQLAAVIGLWRNSILHRHSNYLQDRPLTWWYDNRKIIQAVQSRFRGTICPVGCRYYRMEIKR